MKKIILMTMALLLLAWLSQGQVKFNDSGNQITIDVLSDSAIAFSCAAPQNNTPIVIENGEEIIDTIIGKTLTTFELTAKDLMIIIKGKVVNFNCSGNKESLIGVDLSLNSEIVSLNVSKNALTQLSLQQNSKLKMLNCSDNAISTLNLKSNSLITSLNCSNNLLETLSVDTNKLITTLNCAKNALTQLVLVNNSNLSSLNCSGNMLTSLDVSHNEKLKTLNCSTNALTMLNVEQNRQMQTLKCNKNNLALLQMVSDSSLHTLNCAENSIAFLSVKNFKRLKHLNCSDNMIAELDISGANLLEKLICFKNNLTRLDVVDNNMLSDIRCYYNLLGACELDSLYERLSEAVLEDSAVIYIRNSKTSTLDNPGSSGSHHEIATAKKWRVLDLNGHKPIDNVTYGCGLLEIVSFQIPGQMEESIINAEDRTVHVKMPATADLSSLTPTILVSDGAVVEPHSGVAQDFTSPFVYTLSANGISIEWLVTVIKHYEGVYISEVSALYADTSMRYFFVELFNENADSINFSQGNWWLACQKDGGEIVSEKLSGVLRGNSTFVISQASSSQFSDIYGVPSQMSAPQVLVGDGNDAYMLFQHGDHVVDGELMDIYGIRDQDGTGKNWEYTGSRSVRKAKVNTGTIKFKPSEWVFYKAKNAVYTPEDVSPGMHKSVAVWCSGSAEALYTSAENWSFQSGSHCYPDASTTVVIPSIPQFGQEMPVLQPASSTHKYYCHSIDFNPGATLPGFHRLTVVDSIRYKQQLRGGSNVENQPIYHFVSSPVANVKAGEVFPLTAIMQKYQEESLSWHSLGKDDVMEKGVGYSIRLEDQENSFVYAGKKFNTTATFSGLTHTDDVNGYSGWHLLGNPYPAALDLTKGSWKWDGVQKSVHLWNSETENYLYVNTEGVGTLSPPIIPVGQAFFVYTHQGNGKVTLPLKACVSYSGLPLKVERDVFNLIGFTVDNNRNSYSSTAFISLSSNGINGLDLLDVPLLKGSPAAPSIYFMVEEMALSVNSCRNFYPMDIYFDPGEGGDFTLTISPDAVFDLDFLFKDRITDNCFELIPGMTYSFTSTVGDVKDRFQLLLASDVKEKEVNLFSWVSVWGQQNRILIDNSSNKPVRVLLYNALGQCVAVESAVLGYHEISVDGPNVYFIMLVNEEGRQTRKVMVY